MKEHLKLAAFYLWQYTGYSNTQALWYCAEDIASFFERCQYTTEESVQKVMNLNRADRDYRAFIRHISYRLHLYTGIIDDSFNWQVTEKLLDNVEWRESIIALAAGLSTMRRGESPQDDYQLQSPVIKEYYPNK